MSDTVLNIDLIVSNPNVRSGRPTIAGTSLTVEDIAIAMIYHQQDPDGIAEWYNLSPAQVHAALAYYYAHKEEIDASQLKNIRQSVLAAAISLYLDEHLSPVIASQLRRHNITVYTLQELNLLGDSDINHLTRATEMGCVLCTYDAGIVFGNQFEHGIGEQDKALILVHAIYSAEDMKNHIEYL